MSSPELSSRRSVSATRPVARALALVVGVLVTIVGLVGVVAPRVFEVTARYTTTHAGLLLVGIVRVAIGLVLVRAAAASRLPRTLFVLGLVAIVLGAATPLLGPDRAAAIMEWWRGLGPVAMRLVDVPTLVLGAVIVYATAPDRRATGRAFEVS